MVPALFFPLLMPQSVLSMAGAEILIRAFVSSRFYYYDVLLSVLPRASLITNLIVTCCLQITHEISDADVFKPL